MVESWFSYSYSTDPESWNDYGKKLPEHPVFDFSGDGCYVGYVISV